MKFIRVHEKRYDGVLIEHLVNTSHLMQITKGSLGGSFIMFSIGNPNDGGMAIVVIETLDELEKLING